MRNPYDTISSPASIQIAILEKRLSDIKSRIAEEQDRAYLIEEEIKELRAK